jgi:hypothetical protein
MKGIFIMYPIRSLAVMLAVMLSFSLGLSDPLSSITNEHPLGFNFELLPLTATDLESAIYVYDLFRDIYIAAHSEQGLSCFFTINAHGIAHIRSWYSHGIPIPMEFRDAVSRHSLERRNHRLFYSGIDWEQWCMDNNCPVFIKYGQCAGTHFREVLDLYTRGLF